MQNMIPYSYIYTHTSSMTDKISHITNNKYCGSSSSSETIL